MIFFFLLFFLFSYSVELKATVSEQKNPVLIKGKDAFFMAWLDFRNSEKGDIYLQKYSEDLQPLWENDVKVNEKELYYLKNWFPEPRLAVTDKAVYVQWNAGGNAYLQKTDFNEKKLYRQEKKINVDKRAEYLGSDILLLKNGNIMFFFREMGAPRIFCQKLSADGKTLFEGDKKLEGGYNPRAARSAGESFFLLSGGYNKKLWLTQGNENDLLQKKVQVTSDFRNGSGLNAILSCDNGDIVIAYLEGRHIVMARHGKDGGILWGPLQVSGETKNVKSLHVFADGEGSLLVSWIDYTNTSDGNLFFAKIPSNGKKQLEARKINEELLHNPSSLSLAQNSTGLVAVWEDAGTGKSAIRIKQGIK